MSGTGSVDPVLQQLSRLRPATPDPVRARRLHTRCRNELQRRRRRQERVEALTRPRLLAVALMGGTCAAYVSSLIATLIHVFSVLP